MKDRDSRGESSDESDEGEVPTGFVHASQVTSRHINKLDKEVSSRGTDARAVIANVILQYLKQKKAQLAALGQWTHINCLKPTGRDDVEDDILRRLIYKPDDGSKARTPDTGKNKTRVKSLLDAVELDAVLEVTAPPLAVEDIPGGSVSFLFERTSKTTLDECQEDVRAEEP